MCERGGGEGCVFLCVCIYKKRGIKLQMVKEADVKNRVRVKLLDISS